MIPEWNYLQRKGEISYASESVSLGRRYRLWFHDTKKANSRPGVTFQISSGHNDGGTTMFINEDEIDDLIVHLVEAKLNFKHNGGPGAP